MPIPLPDVRRYAEYRTFLKDYYRALHERDRQFSQRYIALKVGAHSAGWFSDLVAGRQRLKPSQIAKVAAAFKLSERDKEHLDIWVHLERATSPEEKAALSERWFLLRGMKKEAVERERFAYFDHWYHLALRELIFLYPELDPQTLGACLVPPIHPAKAKKAFALLQQIGLAPTATSKGKTQAADLPLLVKAPSGDSKQWQNILTQMNRLAGAAISQSRKEERDISALTLSLSPAGLRKVGDEIAELRKRILLIARKDRESDRIYQCLFHVFPLTRPMKGQP